MTDSPALLLVNYLLSIGQAVEPGDLNGDEWPIVNGTIPPDNARYIGIVDGVPFLQGRLHRTGEHVEHLRAQVIVRGQEYAATYAKCREIEGLFKLIGVDPAVGGVGWVRVSIGDRSYTISAVNLLVPTTLLSQDKDNRRYLFSINVQISLRT